jgi:hypothetical protein
MSRKKLVGIIVACAVIILVVLVISLSGRGPAGDREVNFPDPNLDTAMRRYLGKSPSESINASELAGLTRLGIESAGTNREFVGASALYKPDRPPPPRYPDK